MKKATHKANRPERGPNAARSRRSERVASSFKTGGAERSLPASPVLASIPLQYVNTPGINRNLPRFIIIRGYLHIFLPEHYLARFDGYVPIHRMVAAIKYRREISPLEVIHHAGVHFPIYSPENKLDNTIENIMLFPNTATHFQYHAAVNKATGIDWRKNAAMKAADIKSKFLKEEKP